MNTEKIERIEPDEYKLTSGETIFVHLFRPQDAPGISRLFHAVYGDKYPVKYFYNPEELIRAFDAGDNYSIVARKADGEIIGHNGLFRSAPYPGLYEAGAGLVLPEFRKESVSRFILHHLYERLAPELGLEEVWGEAVCNHVHMQKTVGRFRFIETGLEIDLMPAEAYVKEKSAPSRVSSLVVFRCYVSVPHSVYLPSVYENALRSIYSRLDDRRMLHACSDTPPSDSSSRADFEIFEFAQVARVAVTAIGKDFESYFKALESRILTGKIEVVQVWLNLACPWVGRAVEILRGQGYFFGAVLPRWFGDDALLMQKIRKKPGWESINLFSDWSQELLEIVRNDWEEITSQTGR